jgi:hypothetical protein
MFNQSPDERLSIWSKFRHTLDQSTDPLMDLITFWQTAPFVPYNRSVDPYNQYAWPTPWEIVIENKYDDFTKALMMSWTLKLTDKFKDARIEIKTYTDTVKNRQYNLVFIDDCDVLNYYDNDIISAAAVPETLRLENLIEVSRPR